MSDGNKKQCRRCRERGKNWGGDDPRCAFESGVFNQDNWNCATANALRELADWSWRDDDSAGSIGIVRVPENDVFAGYIVMTWYKSRGCTAQMWVMWDDEPPHPLSLNEAEAALSVMDSVK